jgi:hypothetical protein
MGWAAAGYAGLRMLCSFWLVLSVGMQWAVTQSAGWVSMMVTYAQQGSVMEALEKTFDGEHPCELCKLAAQQSSEADEDGAPTSAKKAHKVKKAEIAWRDEPLCPPSRRVSVHELPEFSPQMVSWKKQPDRPPPRGMGVA